MTKNLHSFIQMTTYSNNDCWGLLGNASNQNCFVLALEFPLPKCDLYRKVAPRHISDSLDNISVPTSDEATFDFAAMASARGRRLKPSHILPGW